MLNGRALGAARRASRALAQPVARSIRPPPDHGDSAGERRTMLALFAMDPYPQLLQNEAYQNAAGQ